MRSGLGEGSGGGVLHTGGPWPTAEGQLAAAPPQAALAPISLEEPAARVRPVRGLGNSQGDPGGLCLSPPLCLSVCPSNHALPREPGPSRDLCSDAADSSSVSLSGRRRKGHHRRPTGDSSHQGHPGPGPTVLCPDARHTATPAGGDPAESSHPSQSSCLWSDQLFPAASPTQIYANPALDSSLTWTWWMMSALVSAPVRSCT